MLLKKRVYVLQEVFFFFKLFMSIILCLLLFENSCFGGPSGNNSLYLYDLQILEKNEEHVVPKSTWAEIVKGEPRNFNVNSIGYEVSFPPLLSSINAEKHDKKGIPPIMNMHQTCEENKKCKFII